MHCRVFSFVILLTMWPSTNSTIACREHERSIRLVNGSNKFEGRVELCDDGQWNSVCLFGWYREEATVACRQLGFSGNLNAVAERNVDVFGANSGEILRVRWKCNGNETELTDCPTTDLKFCGANSLAHNAAGVYCFGNNYERCRENDIRLVGGHDIISGRVEICVDGLWGTVCDDGWDIRDASTVCRQLGYNTDRGIPTRRAYFGEGSGPIHLSNAQCRSSDTQLANCDIDKTGINRCEHNEDAGVICTGTSSCIDGDVQLVGGKNEREGRVEICYNRMWGSVCDYGWDEVDASVVCTQLGFGKKAMALTRFGPGDSPMLLNNVNCNQNDSRIFQCIHPLSIGIHNYCSQHNTAGVKCQMVVYPSTTDTPHIQATARLLSTIFTDSINSTTVVFTVQKVENGTRRGTAADSFSIILLAILGAVGGCLLLIAIALFIVAVAIIRKKNCNNAVVGKDSVDNPTYVDMSIGTLSTTINQDEEEREFQNPLYHAPDLMYTPSGTNLNLQSQAQENMYESLFCDTKIIPYSDSDDYYSVPRKAINEWKRANGGVRDEATSEVIYDTPPEVDNNCEGCCSAHQGQLPYMEV